MKKQSSQRSFRVSGNFSPFEGARQVVIHVAKLAPFPHLRSSQITHFSFTRFLQDFHRDGCKERGNQE
jgi:hypothetical protein